MNTSKMRLSLVMFFLLASVALGATKEELKQRTSQRQGTIQSLKTQGKIGETYDGRVDVRSSLDARQQKTVDEENADRQELYRILADEFRTAAAQIAERSGTKHFENAAPNHWLKTKEGKWVQKKDLKAK